MTPRWTSRLVVACLFAISFFLRWPSCGDSFWLDELHTAWCTFGTFGEVSGRASLGNQQPLYFGALWLWQRVPPTTLIDFYGIEAWMRLTSVVASAASASVAYLIVRRATKSPVGGIAAGLAMALESSSIFYGTELRPYAWVILLSTIAVGFASLPISRASRWGLHLISLLAAATHLTSLIGLAPMIALVMVVDWFTAQCKPHPAAKWNQCHLGPIVVWCLFAFASVFNHVDLWGVRDRWNAFASPSTLWEIEGLWPWISLVLCPGIAAMLTWLYRSRMKRSSITIAPVVRRWMIIICSVVLVSTFGCYLLSAWGGVPLWSRRYLVSGLPMICVLFGCMVGWISQGQRTNQFTAMIVMCFCLGDMGWQSGVLPKLYRGNPKLVVRDEGWRTATRWINQHKETLSIASVWVDPALIEQDEPSVIVANAIREHYFRFVADGPYRLDDAIEVIGTGRNATDEWLKLCQSGDAGLKTVLLTRRRISRELLGSTNLNVKSFGRVKVLRWHAADTE